MIRRCLGIILLTFIILVGANQAFASEVSSYNNHDIVPYMDYISRATSDIYIDSNSKAAVDCSIYGYQTTTTKVCITAELQQYNGTSWKTIKTYTTASNSYRASLSEMAYVSKGYTYRVKATFEAYSGTDAETRIIFSNEVKY